MTSPGGAAVAYSYSMTRSSGGPSLPASAPERRPQPRGHWNARDPAALNIPGVQLWVLLRRQRRYLEPLP